MGLGQEMQYGFVPNNFWAKYSTPGYQMQNQGWGGWGSGCGQGSIWGGQDQAITMMLTGIMPPNCQSPIYFQGGGGGCSFGGGQGGYYSEAQQGSRNRDPYNSFLRNDSLGVGTTQAPPTVPSTTQATQSKPKTQAVTVKEDPVAKALEEAKRQVNTNNGLQNVLYDESGKPYVIVEKWNSPASNGKKYANDCLSRIMSNARPDLKPYSNNWNSETKKVMDLNNNIYNSGRPPVPGGGRMNSLLKDGEKVYLA